MSGVRETTDAYAARARAEITDEDLRLLVWCSMNYDRRLPAGSIPPRIWEMLSSESRSLINQWKDMGGRDQLGAEIRR